MERVATGPDEPVPPDEEGEARMAARLRHLPVVVTAVGAVAVLAAALGGLARGGPGALGAAVGVLLVLFSYILSTVAIAWADSVSPRLVLPVGLTAYLTKFSAFGVALIALLDSDWGGKLPMAAGIGAGVVAWNATHIWWLNGPGRR